MNKIDAALAILAIATISAFSAPAVAQDKGLYLGGSLGQSKVSLDCTGASSCDDKDTSWKIFAGYQVNRNFAIEVGYSNLGEATANVPAFVVGGIPIPASRVSIEATAWELVAVGSLPVAERFSLFGKLGLYRADTDVSIAFTGAGTATDNDSNTDLTFGVGARYDFTRNLGLRAEWQRYSDVKAGDFGDSNVDVLSLGIIYRF
jgi:OOP family OmpA-OmpF porin